MNKFTKIIEFIFFRKKINWLLTIYTNLHLLPFSQAIVCPIHMYGQWKLILRGGKIIINAPVKFGMVKVGIDIGGFVSTKNGRLSILEGSKIIFNGKSNICQGSSIIINKNAILEFGDSVNIGDNVKIICHNRINIGEKSDICWESQITDYNFHYIKNIGQENIYTIDKNINIGNYCWIGNRTTILPGTNIPDRTIVTSNSLLNKNYTANGLKSYCLIGGIPAKEILKDRQRIYLIENEKQLKKYFKDTNADSVHSSILLKKE